MEMDTLSISTDGLSADEVRRVEDAMEAARLARTIRQRFEKLQPEIGVWAALERIAAEHPVSERTVRRIVYGS